MARPGSTDSVGCDPRFPGGVLENAGIVGYRWRLLAFDIRHPQAAAHREFLEAMGLDEIRRLRRRAAAKESTRNTCEPMWRWIPRRRTPGWARAAAMAAGGRAGRQRESEFGVVLSGGDVVVGVGLDPGRDAQEHVEDVTGAVVNPADSSEFVEAVDHQAPDPGRRRLLDLDFALVVAVHDQSVPRDPGGERDEHLSAGRDIDLHPFFVGQPGHRQAEESLAGVDRSFAERVPRLPATGPQMGLVVDEERRPEPGGKIQGRAATDQQFPAGSFRRGVGQKRPGNRGHGAICIRSDGWPKSPWHDANGPIQRPVNTFSAPPSTVRDDRTSPPSGRSPAPAAWRH